VRSSRDGARVALCCFRVSSRWAQIRLVPERKQQSQTTSARLRPRGRRGSADQQPLVAGRRTRCAQRPGRTTMIVKWCVMPVVAAVLLLAPQGQEPKPDRPPPPPAGQPPLPPVEEPYVEPVQRLDLPERFATRDPLEGIWEVRLRSIGGRQEAVTAGHMVIGRRLLIVHFEAPGVK